MDVLQSPWLAQLNRTRNVDRLSGNDSADVVIVGGGIAGVTTAYYILKHTDLSVMLLEASKIAHGATGHNAGQLATYFERPFFELAQDMGIKRAEEGKEAVESAWFLLDEIYRECKLETPMWSFTGWAGSRGLAELLVRLKNRRYREVLGTPQQKIFVADNAPFAREIPRAYEDLYTLVPQDNVLALLETTNREFTAALPARKGCMNSAVFTEELAGFLLTYYRDRFKLAEESPVKRVVLKQTHTLAAVRSHTVSSQYIILCTNGFEGFTIVNTVGPDIDSNFHHSITGVVGYMAAYMDEVNLPPVAISYLPRPSDSESQTGEPYYYLTRRPFELRGESKNLISVGGPELILPDTRNFHKGHEYAKNATSDITRFLHETYKYAPKEVIDFTYRWHGLMGYTPTGVRLAGLEPCNPRLLYNLGCNGVGILPSIYGAFRLSQLLAGKKMSPSIFDPRDISCDTR